MPEPTQLTIDGRFVAVEAAVAHADGSQTPAVGITDTGVRYYLGAEQASRLFTAPQTMRGQLAMPTDTVQR